ncbi:MAG TPA: SymE family type I addiction module toxin [Gemmatimonadaceae bacterium]
MDRRLRVTRSSPDEGEVPMIRMRGKWLGAAGFTSGTLVTVTVSRGQLVLAAGAAAADPPPPTPY